MTEQKKSRLLASSVWSMAGNSAQYIVVFFLLVYLAHVLEPRDFGLMATVSVGLDLGTRIARWGQVELLQQKRYRNDEARNQSLRFSLAIGLVFCLAFVAAARPLGKYFGSDELEVMIYICAPVFLFLATGSTAEAVLRSEFQFKVLAFRSTVSALIGAAVAICLAHFGYGALTLAMQRLVQAVVSGLWIWSAVDWRPSLSRHIRWSADLVKEGASVMTGTLLPIAVPRSIDLVVGFFMGPAMLGLMRVAFRINEFVGQMVVMPLVSVANAELSNNVDAPDVMRRSYLRLTQMSALLMSPILIGLTLVAPEAIPFIFGPQWLGCVPFVQVIGLLALVAPINYYFAPSMIALGQSREVIRQGILQLVLGALLTIAAAQVSLVAIAWAHVMRGLIVSLYNVFDLRKHMGVRIGALAKSLAVPYVATAAMTAAILSARESPMGEMVPHLRLAVLVAVGGASYAVTLWLVAKAGLWPDYALIMKKIAGFRRRRAPALG